MKKILLVAMAIFMVTVLSACGEDTSAVEETTTGAVTENTVKVSEETTEKLTNTFDDKNNQVFVARYSKYDLSKIGITKDISNYHFKLTGESVTATDGEKVFIVYLLENGVYTNYIFGFTPEKDYYYDPALDQYIPLEEVLAR